MQPRQLDFTDFSQVLADIERLQRQGYDRAATWDLAQTCEHLAFFIESSIDGPNYHVPWIFKVLFGRMFLKRILNQRTMKPGVPTPQKPLPLPGGNVEAAVARLKNAIDRFQKHEGDYFPSPFFGRMTPEEWRELHLIHCAHHLGNLILRT